MKYETVKSFVEAAQAGEFKEQVIVDNDDVYAYSDDGELACNFEGRNPHEVLFEILCALSVDVSWA